MKALGSISDLSNFSEFNGALNGLQSDPISSLGLFTAFIQRQFPTSFEWSFPVVSVSFMQKPGEVSDIRFNWLIS